MESTIKSIYAILNSDTTLVNLLASNKPWNNPNGSSSKINSIVPENLVGRKLNAPYIMILEGTDIDLGEELHAESIYIRCYQDINKTNIQLNTIMERIKTLLDNKQFAIENKSNVRCEWEITLTAIIDESLQRKFKESRYRILVL